MKKFIILLFTMFISLPCFAANWVEIFEKQYIDFESIEYSNLDNTIRFWNKELRKDPKEVFPLNNKPYWYYMDRWALDCTNKKSRIESMNVYDLKGKLMYSDDNTPNWNTIIPDTYADGYYRLFCLVPFNENPLLNQ